MTYNVFGGTLNLAQLNLTAWYISAQTDVATSESWYGLYDTNMEVQVACGSHWKCLK